MPPCTAPGTAHDGDPTPRIPPCLALRGRRSLSQEHFTVRLHNFLLVNCRLGLGFQANTFLPVVHATPKGKVPPLEDRGMPPLALFRFKNAILGHEYAELSTHTRVLALQ